MHYQITKTVIWYKVRELTAQGLNQSQVSHETGLDRSTIRKYLAMSEEKFHSWIRQPKTLPHKLADSEQFVKKELERFPYLSAAQIEDRLKEHFNPASELQNQRKLNCCKMGFFEVLNCL